MINRDDMLELTRRMTPARTCFDRIAGAYISETGEIEDTFNIHFGKLSGSEKARNLKLAKTIPFSKTNEQLKEYNFADAVRGKDSVCRLLQAIQQCGLKNDALMEILYEQIADAYIVDHRFAVYVFHGVYDIPRMGSDKAEQWESEEVYEYMICSIGPVLDDYEPDLPVCGFLYPSFFDRSADIFHIAIYEKEPQVSGEGLIQALGCRRE